MQNIPKDVFLNIIFKKMEMKDLLNLNVTCKYFNELVLQYLISHFKGDSMKHICNRIKLMLSLMLVKVKKHM